MLSIRNARIFFISSSCDFYFGHFNLKINYTIVSGDQTLEMGEFKDVDPNLIKTGIFTIAGVSGVLLFVLILFGKRK